MVSPSCAATLPAKASNANNAMPSATPASRAAWYTVFPLRYLVRAAAVLTWAAMVSVEPRIKLSASFYLDISWVEHIDILDIAQDGLVSRRGLRWTRCSQNSP